VKEREEKGKQSRGVKRERRPKQRKEKRVSLWIPEARKQKLCSSTNKSSLAFRTSRDLQV
jgi:hypothetical protein